MAVSGQGGSVKFGVFNICVTNWVFDQITESVPVTNTFSSGWEQSITGYKSGSGIFTFNMDTLEILPGDTFTSNFYLGEIGQSLMASCRLTNIRTRNPARGVLQADCSFEATGPVTYA